MRTAGSILKDAREKQGKTVHHVAHQTRIKEKFLEALDESDWGVLPNFTVAHGFARSYASAVNADLGLVLALLRRDFPKHQTIVTKIAMPLRRTSVWTPTFTLLAVIAIVFIAVSGYLVKEYLQFSAPPTLVLNPVEFSGQAMVVSGKTAPSATVDINGQPVLVDEEGSFQLKIDKKDLAGSEVQVQAVSRTGKKTVIKQAVD